METDTDGTPSQTSCGFGQRTRRFLASFDGVCLMFGIGVVALALIHALSDPPRGIGFAIGFLVLSVCAFCRWLGERKGETVRDEGLV